VILDLDKAEHEGVFYGAILGSVRYNPSVGVTFIFEDAEGMWKVRLEGSNLHRLYRDLTLDRRESVRTGEAVTSIEFVGLASTGRA
jgi:hypothetical protein